MGIKGVNPTARPALAGRESIVVLPMELALPKIGQIQSTQHPLPKDVEGRTSLDLWRWQTKASATRAIGNGTDQKVKNYVELLKNVQSKDQDVPISLNKTVIAPKSLIDPRLKLNSIPTTTAVFRAQLLPPTPASFMSPRTRMLGDKSNLPASAHFLSTHNPTDRILHAALSNTREGSATPTALQRSYSIPTLDPRPLTLARSQSALLAGMSRVGLSADGDLRQRPSSAGKHLKKKRSLIVFKDMSAAESDMNVRCSRSLIVDRHEDAVKLSTVGIRPNEFNDIYTSNSYPSSTPIRSEGCKMATPIEGDMIPRGLEEMDSSMILETYDRSSDHSASSVDHEPGRDTDQKAKPDDLVNMVTVDWNDYSDQDGGRRKDGKEGYVTAERVFHSSSPQERALSSDRISNSLSPSPRSVVIPSNRVETSLLIIPEASEVLCDDYADTESEIISLGSTSKLSAVQRRIMMDDYSIDNTNPLPPRHQSYPIDSLLSDGPPSSEDDLAYAIRTQFGFSDLSDVKTAGSRFAVPGVVREGNEMTRGGQIMKVALICREEDESDDELMIG